jgi:hypothetical protein
MLVSFTELTVNMSNGGEAMAISAIEPESGGVSVDGAMIGRTCCPGGDPFLSAKNDGAHKLLNVTVHNVTVEVSAQDNQTQAANECSVGIPASAADQRIVISDVVCLKGGLKSDGSPPAAPTCIVGGVARVSCFGSPREADATTALQAALDSAAHTVVIDGQPGELWRTRPLYLRRSDLRVIFAAGVVLEAVRGQFRGTSDALLTATNVRNVTLQGGVGSALAMHKADYATRSLYAFSEHRHTLALYGVRGFAVSNLEMRSSGGDGCYLDNCSDVHILNCLLTDHYRQGISVISAVGLLVEETTMANTNGTPPSAGVDLEPNLPSHQLRNITFKRCAALNNSGSGFRLYLHALRNSSEPPSVRFEDCVVEGGRGAAYEVSAVAPGLRGSVALVGSRAHATIGAGLECTRKAPSLAVTLDGCVFRNVATHVTPDAAPLVLSTGAICVPDHWRGKGCPPGWACLAPCHYPPPQAVRAAPNCSEPEQLQCLKHGLYDIGGLTLNNVSVFDNASPRPFLRATAPGATVRSVQGANITVHSRYKASCKPDVQQVASAIKLQVVCHPSMKTKGL